MQTLQVVTEIEKPGTVLVEAYAPEGEFLRQNQAVGFFVRRRYHGDQFMIARWEEFSPRWMKFVGEVKQEWVEKIEAREKLYQTNAEIASVEQGKTQADRQREIAEQAAKSVMSLSQAAKPEAAGEFQTSSGQIKKPTLSLKDK